VCEQNTEFLIGKASNQCIL